MGANELGWTGEIANHSALLWGGRYSRNLLAHPGPVFATAVSRRNRCALNYGNKICRPNIDTESFTRQRGSMKKIANFFALFIVSAVFLAFGTFLSLPEPTRANKQDVQVIEITAKKYEYSASPVHVQVGTKVQLKITAVDHDHGFKIGTVPDAASSSEKAGLVFTTEQECWQLKKGETTVIEFVAQTPGMYSFKCCHTCGLGHKGMKGQIVVEP
jgi:plastocyanin